MGDERISRMISTVLSIDAVGYSRLMNMNDEIALSIFDTRKSIIVNCISTAGGHAFGMAGDSIMAEFGDPVLAVNTALDFQAKIDRLNREGDPEHVMQFRVGVNTGQVMLRHDGVYGDGVNVSARVQEFAPHGGIAISGATMAHIDGRIATSFINLGAFHLKNIILPVEIHIASPGQQVAGKSEPQVQPRLPQQAAYSSSASDPPALALLPFANKTGDPGLDYVCDGIADDVIFGLANTRAMPIISPVSSFQFRDLSIGLSAIGAMLGARYLVVGSITGAPAALRLTASLTDVSNSRLIWTDRFEYPLVEVQTLQKEIGAQIVANLVKEIDRVEQARSFQLPWESLRAWQLVRRGRWHMQRRTSKDVGMALEFFDRAYEEDPNSSPVLNELSWWYLWRSWLNFAEPGDLVKAREYAKRSLLVDSQDARPHTNLGHLEIMRGQPVAAIDFLSEARSINPSDSITHTGLGSANILLSNPATAIAELTEALRLNPLEHYRFHNLGELAAAHTIAQDWQSVIEAADRSLTVAPYYFYARFLKTGALARMGRMEEAQNERQTLLERHSKFQPEWIKWIPFADKSVNRMMLSNFDLAHGGD